MLRVCRLGRKIPMYIMVEKTWVQNERSLDREDAGNVVIGQLGCVTRLENEVISLRG
jgi:hypothetical protein